MENDIKLFKAVIEKPFIYPQNAPDETPCIAFVKHLEAIIPAETENEAIEKVIAILPPKDPNTENILIQNGNRGKYYNIQIKEMEGKGGVYFCPGEPAKSVTIDELAKACAEAAPLYMEPLKEYLLETNE